MSSIPSTLSFPNRHAARDSVLAQRRILTLVVGLLALVVGLLTAAPSTRSAQAADLDDAPQTTRSVVKSGPVTLTVTTNKPWARVAEPIELTIQVDAPQGTRVKMPAVGEALGAFEVLATRDVDELPVGTQLDTRRWQRQFTLETIRTGQLPIPQLEVLYAPNSSGADGPLEFQTVVSDPLWVRIASVLEERADPRVFRDIKDVVDVDVPPQPSWAWVVWTAATLCAFAAIAIAVAWTVKRKRITPAKWALTEISRLEERSQLPTADLDAIYGELADITREFIEIRTGIAASTSTTQEFLSEFLNDAELNDAAQDAPLQGAGQQPLKAFLTMADEVKFAQLALATEHVRHAVQQIRDFIMEHESATRKTRKEAT